MNGNTHSSRLALVGRGATYALIGLSLAACGGGSQSTSTPTSTAAQALAITTSNASALTNELIQTEQFLPNIPSTLYTIVNHTPSCTAGGSVTTTGSSSAPPETFTFSQCKPIDNSSEKSLYKGSLVFDYPSATAKYPLSLTAGDFTTSNVRYDSSGAPRASHKLSVNADLTASSAYNVGINGTFYLSATNSGNDLIYDWSFKNYQLTADSSRKGPDKVNGQQTLNDLGGYVDISTDQDMTYGTSTTCPITGQITVNGAGSSYLKLAFNGGDSVTVTVNGNANLYTCSAFNSWVGPILSPLR